MKILIFGLSLLFAYADPFYYGESPMESESLKLYGLMNDRANLNGKWHKVQTTFKARNTSFKILKIQNPCVFLEESSTQEKSKLCLQKSKLLRN